MMWKKVSAILLALSLCVMFGFGSAIADSAALEKDDTITTNARGNDNGHPPSVLPPQT